MLELQNVSAHLKNGTPLCQKISLQLKQEEICGLIGPNGAGKTSLFSLILGLIPLASGSIFMNSRDISKLSAEQRMRLGLGYLPQDGSLFHELSVQENLECLLECKEPHLSKIQRRQKIEELLSHIGLKDLAKKTSLTLSGGQKRRLEFARLLAIHPEYILLDEPFAGVDPKSIEDIQDHIMTLRNHNIGIMISDHNLSATFNICDTIHVLIDGQIIASESPQKILADPLLQSIYLGSRNIHFAT